MKSTFANVESLVLIRHWLP